MPSYRQQWHVVWVDRRLISSGVDGAVYEWRVATMRRERENVLKAGFYAHYLQLLQLNVLPMFTPSAQSFD